MPKPFEFEDPYTLVNEGDGVFSLRCHSIRVASYAVQSWGSEQRCIEAAWALAYAPSDARITLEGVRGAVSRGWCAPENSHKEMDPDLADAIAREVYALVADA